MISPEGLVSASRGRAAKSDAPSRTRLGWLVAGLGVGVVVRSVLAGHSGAASALAAAVFALIAGGLAVAAGWRPGRLSPRAVVAGLGGGLVLVAGPLTVGAGASPVTGVGTSRLAWWVVVVSAVAVSEEVFLRGALWESIESGSGPLAALTSTSVVFAVMHVPLYGWHAVPLDLAVGALLGGLRMVTGGVASPAVAHWVADVAGGWI